jgi:signal transduction histidine kinase
MASEGFPQTTPLDDPIVEVLRRTRRPMIIADIRTDPRFRSWPGMELVRGWMGMPLFAGKEMIGVLSLAHLKPGAFTHSDAEVAELFTRQVADVLDKARQYEETHRRSEELELLSKFSLAIRHAESQENVLTALMEQTTRVFGANQGTFLLLDKDASTLMVSFSQDKSLVGEWHIHGKDLLWQVLRNDRPQFYSSLEKVLRENPHSFYQILFRGMQSAALVPLHTAEGTFGLLVFTFNEPRNFSGEDQRLFGAIAEIAATALRRAAILEALETQVVTRTRHLSTFYEISAVTSEPADLEVLLPRVLRITLDAMNSHIGAIYLLDEAQNRLHLTAQYNLPEEELPRFENLSLQTPFWRNLLLSGEPVVIPDLSNELRVPEGFRLPGNQAFLGAPVRAKGKPLGLLSMFGETILNYTIEDITLFTTIADQVGSVVERARLYKQAERAAVAEERQRLARDLHDSVTQLIYSLVLYAGAGNKVLKQNNLELVDEYLARIHQTSLQALKEMRLLVYELRPSVFREEGLIGALHHRLKAVEERTGIKAELIADRDIEIDEATEQTLYRIAEEALNNTLKHAKASHVQIRLSAHENRVQLSICDDGCGFNLDEGKKRGGLGLIGIDERARNLGGDLQITTAPGQGTIITVNLEVVE